MTLLNHRPSSTPILLHALWGLSRLSYHQRLSTLSGTNDLPVHELRLIQRDLIRLNNQKNTVLSMLEDNIWRADSSEELNPEIYSDIKEPEYDPVDFLDSQLDDKNSKEEPTQ